MLNLTKPLIAIMLTLGLVHTVHSEELLLKSVPEDEYTIKHAAHDMEIIYQRLQQSTVELQEVAQSFTTLVDRLEEKQNQQLTATTH